MADLVTLDQSYRFIMGTLLETGRAPHYTELAADLGVSMEEGRMVLHELMEESGLRGYWLHPGTSVIASFAPFNNLPTHYRITVEREQKWFGQ